MEQKLSGGTKISMRRILLPSLLRLSIGYLFLLTLFVVVVQSSSVLNMFFDVLALEFVENIDDVIFGLAKRGESTVQYILSSPCWLELTKTQICPGFFGHNLRDATRPHFIESSHETHILRRWTKRCIRFFYISNIFLRYDHHDIQSAPLSI